MTNTYCVGTVLRYSWWWTVDMPETCRILCQINLRNGASSWLYYKNMSRCTVLWMSNNANVSSVGVLTIWICIVRWCKPVVHVLAACCPVRSWDMLRVVTHKSNIIMLNKLARVLRGNDANIWRAGPVCVTHNCSFQLANRVALHY
jgi:hypothetical protein